MAALAFGWAGSQGTAEALGVPLFGAGVGAAFLIQWVAFVPAYRLRSERFFDLVGSLTFLAVTSALLWMAPERDMRAWVLAILIVVWAARLGTFLVLRIRSKGKDGRFDDLKNRFRPYLTVWTLQGLWVSTTAGAAWASMLSIGKGPMGWVAWLGVLTWATGFLIETVADEQKRRFRENPANRDRFIQSGLWGWSRHPNYFGEIILWLGVALVAVETLQGWSRLTLASPLIVAALLTRVSGIPPLEQTANQRWGDDPEYQAYKAETPALFPRPPARKKNPSTQ